MCVVHISTDICRPSPTYIRQLIGHTGATLEFSLLLSMLFLVGVFVPVVCYPLDDLTLIQNLPPQPLLIPLLELLLRVCGNDEISGRDTKAEYHCVLLQLLRLILTSYGPRPGTKSSTSHSPRPGTGPITQPDLLLSALITAVKTIGFSSVPLHVAPVLVRELLALSHTVLDIARGLVAPKQDEADQQQQQQQQQRGQQQQGEQHQQQQEQDEEQVRQQEHEQQQSKSKQQGGGGESCTEHNCLLAQQFLHVVGRLLLYSQQELAYMMARLMLEIKETAAEGPGAAAGGARAVGGSGGAGAAAGGAAVAAGGAKATAGGAKAVVGGGAAETGGAGAANTRSIPNSIHAALLGVGFSPVPAKEGCGFKVYHNPDGRYLALGPAICSSDDDSAAWDVATSVVYGMDQQCGWEACHGLPGAAIKQLSAKLYRTLALMPEAVRRQVEVVLEQVGVRIVPLWVPTGFAGAGCQKARLIQLWQETCGELHGEKLAVILAALGLLGRGLVDGFPSAFACNNGLCRNLEGFGELALVRGRAQVVCGGV